MQVPASIQSLLVQIHRQASTSWTTVKRTRSRSRACTEHHGTKLLVGSVCSKEPERLGSWRGGWVFAAWVARAVGYSPNCAIAVPHQTLPWQAYSVITWFSTVICMKTSYCHRCDNKSAPSHSCLSTSCNDGRTIKEFP